MKINDIKALAEVLSTHNLTMVEFSEGNTKIKLERNLTERAAVNAISVSTNALPAAAAEAAPGEESLDFNKLTEVKSPLVGVFYSAPSPDAAPFVTIGRKVKRGDVLCIVEAMKLMNEITAEAEGEIVDICVKNGNVVEFGQVLFKMF